MTVKLLTKQDLEFLSLKGGYIGLSESNHVKMPHCWKSHVTAHISSCVMSQVQTEEIELYFDLFNYSTVPN